MVPYPSFEAAAEDVIGGKIEVVLVPAAYPLAYFMIQSAELTGIQVFVVQIPPLVIAGLPESEGYGKKLFYPPATAPLLPEVAGRYVLALTVGSNVEASRSAVEEAGTVCITNAICAERFGLKTGVRMPFLVFAAAKRGKIKNSN